MQPSSPTSGISTANALDFDKSGLGFVAGENNTKLYDMSSSGVLGNFLSMSPFTSAGDITFYNGYIVVPAQDGSFNGSEPDDLVFFNPATRRGVTYYTAPIKVLYGLYSTGTNELYGLGTPACTTSTSRTSRFTWSRTSHLPASARSTALPTTATSKTKQWALPDTERRIG